MTKWFIWILWFVLALGLAGYLGNQMFAQDQKPDFLIGQTTHGHYQIELECTACHESAFGGDDVLQNACVNCHGAELKASLDSHPKTKFTDPRNADRLEKIDARYCVSCHAEHNPDITHPMGVTLPTDFCFHCHQDIGEERESHQGMAFNTCASAGCHNYHDNRALYEDFLIRHAHGDWLAASPKLIDKDLRAYIEKLGKVPQEPAQNATPASVAADFKNVHQDWFSSAHAQANIGCNSCHGDAQSWAEKPSMQVCQDCHQQEFETFGQGKHGMRIAQGLDAMTPELSVQAHNKLAFNQANLDKPLTCMTCHNPHTVDVVEAAVSACLSCHQDDHSQAFLASPHGQLWQQFEAGQITQNEAVSCASCHMPRLETEHFGIQRVLVQHNQNATLRPNEKMIRPTCMSCHSLVFSIDALADPSLILNNFAGQPAKHINSVDMSLERAH